MLNSKLLKKVFLLLAFMLSISFVSFTAYAVEKLPKINFVGVEHSPLVVGDSESFYVTSGYEGMVQYRARISKDGSNLWEDITQGYSKAVNANIPYIISSDKKFSEGKYKLSIWVKRADADGVNKSSEGSYDSDYIVNLNCVNKDDNNRVYVNSSMDIEKEEYTLGEQVIINGINNISGIKGPYKYKLHYFSPSKAKDKNSGWVKNVTDYDNKIVWTPTEPGIYVLDVHVNTEASTTWNTYLNKKKENKLDNVAGTYEAWKLKVITVKEKIQDEKEINLSEGKKVYGALDNENPEIMNKDINFTAESVTLKNIKQTGNINMLKDKAVLSSAEVTGNVNIQGNYSNMYNVKVNGIITINPGDSGVVYLNNVQANEIQILSGATESIHLNNVTTPRVIVNSNSTVRVESMGKTVIDKVTIKSNAILENANSSIKVVELMPKENSKIDLKGNFELVNITKQMKLNILEGKISKLNTTVPFTLMLDDKAFITEMDKNKCEVAVQGKATNIQTIKNDNSTTTTNNNNSSNITPGGGTNTGNAGGNDNNPIEEKLLTSMSVGLNNNQVIKATGSDSELYIDISNLNDLDKLLYIEINASKDCTLNIRDFDQSINVTVKLLAGESKKITPNDLLFFIDIENDGVSLLKLREKSNKEGYLITVQKLTCGNESFDVTLKVKVK